ncbi:MAG: hypothetical protein ABJD13_00445 [Paracoccaceae bacterium]
MPFTRLGSHLILQHFATILVKMYTIFDLFRPKKKVSLAYAEAGETHILCSMEKPHTRFPHQHSRTSQTIRQDDNKYTQFDRRQTRQSADIEHFSAARPNELMASKDTDDSNPNSSPATTQVKPHSVPIDILRKALPGRCNVHTANTAPSVPSIHDAFDEDQDN